MTARERFLTALNNKKPDRLPCQVHNFMGYYLKTYLKGMTDLQAYEYLDMDVVLYREPVYIYDDKDLADWDKKIKVSESGGTSEWELEITTPEGVLRQKGATNQYTGWITEQLVKDEKDFEIWNKYVPLPVKVDWTPVNEAKKLIGDRGIVRGSYFDFGQGSPWQSFVGFLYETQQAIIDCFDKPDWIHYALKSILDKKLKVIEIGGNIELDLVETGGGAGSSTVISPTIHKEFCLPYDVIQHKALHNWGCKIVYHLCGGLMPLLETVALNGADALETMTPKTMGGDCDMEEASKRVGDMLCFIGGFDQNEGFERGNKDFIEKEVYRLFKAKSSGGYICSPSDHFFFGEPDNIRFFNEVCKRCKY
jgi:uroporphyrinogen decarboxylase